MAVLWIVALMSWAYQANSSYGGAAVEALRPPVLIPLRGQSEELLSSVEWKKERQLVARFNRGRCDYGCGNTSQIFPNGSLWLSHGSMEEEGRYSVTVYNSNGFLINQMNITLRIIEIPMENVLGPGNTSVLLPLDSETWPVQVNWRKDDKMLGEVHRGICVHGCNDKNNIFPNGSILLRYFQAEDEGRYSAEEYNAENRLICQTEILIYIYGTDNLTNETSSGHLSKSRLPDPVIILIIEGAIFFVVLVVSMTFLGNFLCKRRKRRLGHKMNIQLPLSTVTTQVPGEIAGTESGGQDGAQHARIYQSQEELTTFIPTDKTKV